MSGSDFEVEGDLQALIREARTLNPDHLLPELNRAWAEGAAQRAREYMGGGPITRYLTMRGGGTRQSVQATSDAQGGEVSASSPGMEFLEEGGTITPKRGKYLTFRLHNAWDGMEPTGAWVRARSVTIPARHPIRDAAQQALEELNAALDTLLKGAA